MRKVLIVDDTKNIRALLRTCLEVLDYEVFEASSGIDAVKALDEEIYDVIFLDIKMPEVSGTEVLKQMRAKNINTPVIIMTAFATVKNAIDCTKLGAILYLQKPFSADKIKSVLKDIEPYMNSTSSSIKNYNEEFTISDSCNNFKDLKSLIKEYHTNMKLENFKYARDILNKALCDYPDNSLVYECLSNYYEACGNKALSLKFYKMSEILK